MGPLVASAQPGVDKGQYRGGIVNLGAITPSKDDHSTTGPENVPVARVLGKIGLCRFSLTRGESMRRDPSTLHTAI